jgi:hypothetical protein
LFLPVCLPLNWTRKVKTRQTERILLLKSFYFRISTKWELTGVTCVEEIFVLQVCYAACIDICRRFDTNCRSYLQTAWPLEMGPKSCPETSVN